MAELIACPRAGRRCPRQGAAHGQRGDIMLVTMVFLLVCLLGLVVSMREGIVSTLMGGNNLARQRDVQISDIALRQIEGQIDAAAHSVVLNISAFSQPWMRISATTSVFAPPGPTYWDSCLGNTDSTLRCGSVTPTVNGSPLGYSVLMVVQYTGRGNDPDSCQTSTGVAKQTATYFDVFVHVKEANGVTSSNTHTIYRQCT